MVGSSDRASVSAVERKLRCERRGRGEGFSRASKPEQYAPDETVTDQLSFALKWEGVNLAVLRALFRAVPAADIAAAIRATPSGTQTGRSGWTPRYSRRYRTGRWCSPSPSGSAPTACTDGGFRPDGTFVTWPAHDTGMARRDQACVDS